MRNLKKFLALVLAMMMVFGLMVTANAATDFPDDAEISDDYREAVEVISALGLYKGDQDTGNLNPTAPLKRSEFAVLLYRLYTGDMVTVPELEAGTSKSILRYQIGMPSYFVDIDEDSNNKWVIPWTNYLYQAEILKGDGSLNFAPDDNVSIPEMLVAMMRVMGVDTSKIDGNPNWVNLTINAAVDNNLVENLDGENLRSGEGALREVIAQITLNGLKTSNKQKENWYVLSVSDKYTAPTKSYPSYEDAVEGAIKDGTVATGYSAKLNDTFTVYSKMEDDKEATLGYEMFKLKWDDGVDADGRPVTVYTREGESEPLVTAVKDDVTPTEPYIVPSSNKDKKVSAIVTTIDKTIKVGDVYVDGVKATKDDTVKTGDSVVCYVNEDGVATVVVTRYYAGVVQAKPTTSGSGTNMTVTVDTNNTDITSEKASNVRGYNDLEAGDVICWYKDIEGVYHIEKLTSEFDAKLVSSKSGVYTLNNNGKYELLGTVSTVTGLTSGANYEDEYHFYTVNGFIVAAVKVGSEGQAPTAKDYVAIIEIDAFKGSNLNEGYTVQARIVHMATNVQEVVTVASAKISGTTYTISGTNKLIDSETGLVIDAIKGTVEKGIYTCTSGAGGYALELVSSALEAKSDNASNHVKFTKGALSITGNNSTSVKVDNATVFLVATKPTGEDHKFNVYTGSANTPNFEVNGEATAGDVVWYVDENTDNVADYVFVPKYATALSTGDAGDSIFILSTEANGDALKTADGDYYEYKAIVDGQYTTVTILNPAGGESVTNKIDGVGVYTPTYDKDGNIIGLSDGPDTTYCANDQFSYTRTKGGLLTTTAKDASSGNIDSHDYVCGDDVPVFIVNDAGTVTTSSGKNLTSDPNDHVFVVHDGGDTTKSAIYVVIYQIGNGTRVVTGNGLDENYLKWLGVEATTSDLGNWIVFQVYEDATASDITYYISNKNTTDASAGDIYEATEGNIAPKTFHAQVVTIATDKKPSGAISNGTYWCKITATVSGEEKNILEKTTITIAGGKLTKVG